MTLTLVAQRRFYRQDKQNSNLSEQKNESNGVYIDDGEKDRQGNPSVDLMRHNQNCNKLLRTVLKKEVSYMRNKVWVRALIQELAEDPARLIQFIGC